MAIKDRRRRYDAKQPTCPLASAEGVASTGPRVSLSRTCSAARAHQTLNYRGGEAKVASREMMGPTDRIDDDDPHLRGILWAASPSI